MGHTRRDYQILPIRMGRSDARNKLAKSVDDEFHYPAGRGRWGEQRGQTVGQTYKLLGNGAEANAGKGGVI